MPQTLPTADEFFGAAGKLPTADEFFGKPYRTLPMDGNVPGVGYVGEIPTSNEAIDQYLASSSTGHVLSAFGQGLKEGWGAGDVGMSKETEDSLRKAGIFNDYQKGHFSVSKAFNEAWMRPAATALDTFLRSGTAAFSGVESAVAQTGEELGSPGLGREAAGLIEYIGTRGELPGGALPKPPVDIAKARSLGVIGEGEAGWKGTAQPDVEARSAAADEAIKTQTEAAAKAQEETGAPAVEPQVVAPAAPAAPDIHAVARQIAPETFQQFDALAQRKQVFQRWIAELKDTRDQQVAQDAPHAQEIADLQSKMEDATPRLRKKYQTRLDEMQDAHDAYVDEHTASDSPDMAKIRQKLMETDYAMRDLAPDVGKAYRDAQAQMPAESQPVAQTGEAAPETPQGQENAPAATAESQQPIPVPAQAENPNVSPVQQTPVDLPVAPPEAVAKPQVTPFDDVRHISDDVAKKLVAAGRPTDEAEAAAKLIASHYWARAARFNGEKGTGLDLYKAEAPEIKAGRSRARAKEFAQKGRELNQSKTPLPMDFESRMARAKDQGFEGGWFHGSARTDRLIEKGKIDKKRATSGPMPFFTRNPEMASNYAMNKIDTSLPDNGEISSYFTVEPKQLGISGRTPVTVERSWHLLPQAVKQEILAKAKRVGYENPDEASGPIILHPEGVEATLSPSHYDWVLKYEARGNPLAALREMWHDGGNLVGDEGELAHIWKLAGYPYEISDKAAPWHEARGVMPVMLRMKNPLRTDNIDEITNKVIPALDEAFKRDRTRKQEYGADMWDKNTRWTPKEWVAQLKEDVSRGAEGSGSGYTWTSIPDKVTAELKKLGYDGIVDVGGKGGGPEHQVAIPFEPNQVRSRYAAFNPAMTDSDRLLAQGAKGKINIAQDARNTITLFKDADASTFIHETGHQWLEELMGDAKDEKAPADLVNDAQTVRDWLGVKDGEEIPRKAHEKFARGFETYMMEGRAPSSGLAKVFEQFRQWLTSIYQTVAKLRAPINDDIRDVFDRLVVANPERTVIAPEREVGKGFADLHEADAESTPPHEAAETADRIRQEADQIVREKDPEVADELNGPASETGRDAGQNAEVAGNGNAPGPVAGEAGPVAESGAVVAGGDESAAEGGPIPERPAEPVEPVRQPGPVTEPNQRFAERNPELIDKAGNIRLDKFRGPEDFDRILKEAADRNNGFIEQRRGVISDGQALDLADALGKDPAFIDRKKIGDAFNEEEIIFIRKLLVQSAGAVREAFQKAASGSDADVVALAETLARHEMIQGKAAQAYAEWGRAGRALNMVIDGSKQAQDLNAFLKANTGRDLFQLREMAQYGMNLQTPQQVSKFVADTSGGKLKRAIVFYYVNALISGPITHTRYAIGNAVNALFTPLVEIPSAAAVGAFRQHVLGQTVEDRVYLGEAGAQIYGLMKGSRDGLVAATEAFKTANSPLLPTERASAHFMEQNANPIPGPIGTAIGIPGRSVAAIHSFFKSLRYEQNIQGLAYRQAVKEGLDGNEFTNRVAQLTETPTDDMMASATKDALKELFMSPTDFHSPMGALTRFTNQSLVAKIIVPFMKIGSQITRNAFIERTPIGLASKDVRGNVFGANGGAAQDIQIGKMVAGTAVMATAVGMAAEGLVTGDGPSDPRQRAVWMLNHKPNHMTIGDTSIPYQGLGPIGMLMRFSANMYETAHGWNDQDGGKLAVAFMEGITKSILDENFMRGVKDLVDAIYHPEEYGQQYIQNFVTNWMPFSVGSYQIARQIDPYMRDTHADNIIDGIFKEARAKTPGLSQTLYPRVDMFGLPVPSQGTVQTYAGDHVVETMERLGVGVGKLQRKIRGVELSDQQYYDYSRLAGQMAKTRLDAVVGMPGFDAIPKGKQVELITKQISGAREAARSLIMMQNPEIIQHAMDDKVSVLNTGKKPH